MITLGWFDWIDVYPLWLQVIIGFPIACAFIAVITCCVIGIKKMIKWTIANIGKMSGE